MKKINSESDENPSTLRPLYSILTEDKQAIALGADEYRQYLQEQAEAGTLPEQAVIKQTKLGPYLVSTVFLPVDHNFSGEGPPILFETLIFHRASMMETLEEYQDRCCTWQEALDMHYRGCQFARSRTFSYWLKAPFRWLFSKN